MIYLVEKDELHCLYRDTDEPSYNVHKYDLDSFFYPYHEENSDILIYGLPKSHKLYSIYSDLRVYVDKKYWEFSLEENEWLEINCKVHIHNKVYDGVIFVTYEEVRLEYDKRGILFDKEILVKYLD